MRSVNIGELKNQLSGYLQYVRDGEEIVVRDRRVPIARIVPFRPSLPAEKEAALVASGAMRMPVDAIDWDAFFAKDAGRGTVSREIAVKAAIEARGDRWRLHSGTRARWSHCVCRSRQRRCCGSW